MVTLKFIAKKLKVSPSTISRALNNDKKISISTREAVQRIARELKYEPNQTAIFFKKQKSFIIGIIVPDIGEAFFSQAINGFEDTALNSNYSVLIGQSHNDEQKEKRLVNMMKMHRVDGLIVSVAKNTSNYEHFESLKNLDIPVVFFDCIPPTPNIHYVVCNIASGTAQAFSFLRNLGHKRIGMINGPKDLPASKQRLLGYRNAVEKAHLKYDPYLVESSLLKADDIMQATTKLLLQKNRPTAIIAFNDYVLTDAYNAVGKMGLKVNKDISFVGFCNLPILSYLAHPPLASIEQFGYKQGQKAMEIILNLLSANKQDKDKFFTVNLDPELIVTVKQHQ